MLRSFSKGVPPERTSFGWRSERSNALRLPVYLWSKTAAARWVTAHEELLQKRAGGQLVVVGIDGRKRLALEIVCHSRQDSSTLFNEFGGRIDRLPRNWLQRFARADAKQIKIGKRLVISNVGATSASRRSRREPRSSLTIPAALAFGTGDHATTAMSLRLLEQLTRNWKPGWSLVDLGTGSGILALAAKCLGAGSVIGIDNDPAAIRVAKSNARLNKIHGTSFQLADVHTWNFTLRTDLIMANLYSDLLIELLAKLNAAGWLILSGILRSQQHELIQALHQNGYKMVNAKHRGKWVAILAHGRAPFRAETCSAKFLRQP